MTSPFIYINAPLPTAYRPPHVSTSQVCDAHSLKSLIEINDVAVSPVETGTIEERLLSIFLDPEVLFGDPSFIPTNRQAWLDRIRYFTSRNLALEFVAMAFPYKVPNPLKTPRSAPDLGEALMLRRFGTVLNAVADIYAPGGRLTILEEGILGRCQGVEPRRIAAYRAGIANVVKIAGLQDGQLEFHSLDDMVTEIPNFEARWIFEQERMRELWHSGDEDVRAAYETTTAASRTSVPTLDYDPAVLAAAYDNTQTDSALRYVRNYIDLVEHHQFFAYRSLLTLRDVTGYLHNLRPNAIKLTVSPKPENLAVLPVNRWSRILPYHGVPVLHSDSRWDIQYYAALGDLGPVEAIHLADDADSAPIAYRVISE